MRKSHILFLISYVLSDRGKIFELCVHLERERKMVKSVPR